MSVKDKNAEFGGFAPMPPEKPEIQQAFLRQQKAERKQKRNKRWSRIGGALLALLAVQQAVSTADPFVTEAKYHRNDLKVELLDGAKDMPDGGLMFLVVPGAGQKSSINAATELFNASEHKFKVAYIEESDDGFTIQQLALATEHLLDETKPDTLGVEGTSMGANLGLAILSYIEDNAKISYYKMVRDEGLPNKPMLTNRKLPEVQYFVANSSTYNVMSARQGWLVEHVTEALQSSHTRAGMQLKFVYSMLDSEDQVYETANVLTFRPQAIAKFILHVVDSAQQTWNDTAPQMVQDQITNLPKDSVSGQLHKVLSPSVTTFIYFYPGKGSDKIVDDSRAYNQYVVALQPLDVVTQYVPTDSTEHADTLAAADTLSGILATDSRAAKIGNVFFPPLKNSP